MDRSNLTKHMNDQSITDEQRKAFAELIKQQQKRYGDRYGDREPRESEAPVPVAPVGGEA